MAAQAIAGPSGDNKNDDLMQAITKAGYRGYLDTVFRWVNGFDPRPFSRADVGVIPNRTRNGITGRLLYQPGLSYLKSGNREVAFEEAYKCLQDFLEDADTEAKHILKVFNNKNASETELTVVLAVHLFGKLVRKGALTVHKDMKKLSEMQNKCPCGCNGTFQEGFTGIGLANGWHGYPDMIVNDVAVALKPNCPPDDAPADKQEDNWADEQDDDLTPPPTKMSRSSEEAGIAVEEKRMGLKDDVIASQMVSQTVANSYAQSNRKPDLRKKFVPSICCSKQGSLIYAYNVDHDIFISNVEEAPLFNMESESQLYLPTIIEIWLALNVHVSGTEAKKIKPLLMKSRFQDLEECAAESKYQNALFRVSAFEENMFIKAGARFFDQTFVNYYKDLK